MHDKLPSELKENALFCLWRHEDRDVKITKVPYQVNGERADVTKESTFSGFRIVVNAVSSYDGISILLRNPYRATDVDHYVARGKLPAWHRTS